MIKTRKIKDIEELKQLIEKADNDNHSVIGATHVMIKNDEIVGYFSIGGMVHVHVWCDSEKMTASDSMIALSQAEAIMSHDGISNGHYVMFCDEKSPFHSKMEKLGFNGMFRTNLYSKEV